MRGFSLIEVMISMALLTFIIGGIYGVLNVGNLTYYTDMHMLDLQQYSRNSMDWMVKELRETASSSITIVSLDEDNERITFNTPNETAIQYYRDISDINSDTITNQVIREYPSGTYRILGNDIGNLSFCCWHSGVCNSSCANSTSLQIELTANQTVFGKDLSFPLIAKVRVRND